MTLACRNARLPHTVLLVVLLSASLPLHAGATDAKPMARKWVAAWGQAMTSQYVQAAGRDGKPALDAYDVLFDAKLQPAQGCH